MGFFKSMRELNKQGQAISNEMDVGAMIADGQARMADANQMMAQQTAAANAALNGLDATAMITAIRQGSGMVNYQPIVEIDLNVMAPGRPPYAATVKQVMPQVHLPRMQPGASVRVKIDPNDPNSVWIDAAGVP